MKLKVIFVFFLCLAPFVISQQSGELITAERQGSVKGTTFSLHLNPGLDIPLGTSADYFNLGGSVTLIGEYSITESPLLFLAGQLGYNLAPIKAEKLVHLINGGAGGGIYLDVTPRLSLKAFASGGYFFGMLNASSGFTTGTNPFLTAGAGIYYLLSPGISLGLSASYKNYVGLYNGLSAMLGTSLYLSGTKQREAKIQRGLPLRPGPLTAKVPGPGEGIKMDGMEFDPVFPVFHSYYDDHPIGRVVLRNQEQMPISDISVSLFIKQFMDTSKLCIEIEEMQGGEEKAIDLNALFTDSILSVTEGTKVAAEITLEYKMKGEMYQVTHSETVRIYHRNAMTWDDDRKAFAFVTAKDPAILSFAKNVVSIIQGKTAGSIDANLLKAIALNETLSLYGVSYVVDPTTPYIEFSKKSNMVDFLQFPRQTLDYKAGDCDDLSILYSALLEAVGIETAFITVPGHIYMAFRLAMEPQEAKRTFMDPQQLIFREEKVWVPVEITEREGGFMKAWQIGAREWREYFPGGQARFYPTHDAWTLFEPVGLPGEEKLVAIPAEDRLLSAYQQEVRRFVNQEIYPWVSKLEAKIKSSGGSPELRNKLGVLYAKYGLFEKAEEEFNKILSTGEVVPTLVNLGNIYYLKEDWHKALEYYERAYQRAPSNSRVLLPIARVHHMLENYGLARRTYQQLKELDPALAERFAYLDLQGETGVRAAKISEVEGVVVWSEE